MITKGAPLIHYIVFGPQNTIINLRKIEQTYFPRE
jgi:hypothetical protein